MAELAAMSSKRTFQINNENQMYFALLEPGKRFNLSRDVLNAKRPR